MTERTLARRYELLELIGGGGMADVYKAHDKLLDRPVAVKILHAQFSNDADFIDKFHREAQGAARLAHPNIVNIYDVGEEAGSHYIVMEYVPGDTLKTRIQQEGHLSVEESLQIAKDIASALEQAHRNNLVHCDIKPHNILMMPDGHIKVADFGIARAVTASTMTYSGSVIGSVHYFSPEQAKGSMITPKSDIYSLGVVMYEMLTGQLPFTGETSVGIAIKHLQEEAPTVRQADPSIPPVVEAIVSKAMGKVAEDFTRDRLKQPFTVWTEWMDAQGDSGVQRFFAFVRDANGRDLGQELVGNGLACVYGAQADHPEGPNRMARWGILDQRLQQAKAQKLGCYGNKVK